METFLKCHDIAIIARRMDLAGHEFMKKNKGMFSYKSDGIIEYLEEILNFLEEFIPIAKELEDFYLNKDGERYILSFFFDVRFVFKMVDNLAFKLLRIVDNAGVEHHQEGTKNAIENGEVFDDLESCDFSRNLDIISEKGIPLRKIHKVLEEILKSLNDSKHPLISLARRKEEGK